MTIPSLFPGAALVPDWPFGDLAPMSADVIMADPPWRFRLYSEAGEHKSPQRHYACMDLAAIKAMPVGELAGRHAMLWLWATWPMLPQALEIMAAWGFKYTTGGAWDKGRWGPGYVHRSVTEPWLIGTRGSPRIDGRSVPNVIRETRREHSRKPEMAYALAERMMPGATRIELFARTRRPGWQVWGDEAEKFAAVAATIEEGAHPCN